MKDRSEGSGEQHGEECEQVDSRRKTGVTPCIGVCMCVCVFGGGDTLESSFNHSMVILWL